MVVMYCYEVWIGSPKFHSKSPLTYSSDQLLEIGEIVSVPLRSGSVVGFIHQRVPVPKIKLKAILERTKVRLPQASLALHSWLHDYYPAASGSITNLFTPAGLPKRSISPKELLPATNSDLPKLTSQQSKALKQLSAIVSGSVLLHGDTGTGKTRLYMELARQTLASQKSVIILTPEIGLTPQLERDFTKLFPNQVVILHSDISSAQRRDRWYDIAQSTKPLIVIGPRSALFSPLSKIGLVVVDEAHEHTYKQEQAPYYQTTRVAAQLARIHKALCVFGTATPLVSDYYAFKQKSMPIIRLTELARGKVTAPVIQIINLKERPQASGSTSLSKQLLSAIHEALENGQQTLLFLNRRGSARLVLCQSCGWQALCPNCDIALTYHQDHGQLRCHTCGYSQTLVTSCPKCGSPDVLYSSSGTKSLAKEVQTLFPAARVKRFDSDNLASEKLEQHFTSLVDGQVDIIVGTQLVTKGLDLPKLGLVGIINADTNLNIPDYTAEEQTYQLLTQVIGRVGRHQDTSRVFIQTYNPDNPLFKLVTSKDWSGFYTQQLKQRQAFGFPPFLYLLQLTIQRSSRSNAVEASKRLAESLSKTSGCNVRGPSPRLHEKVRGKYYWQIIVASTQRQRLLKVITDLPSGWQYNLDPTSLL